MRALLAGPIKKGSHRWLPFRWQAPVNILPRSVL